VKENAVIRGQQILIVDSDSNASGDLAHELTRHGLQVTRVHTADETASLALSRSRSFDAIIMETQLPDGDGCELCAKLRRSGLQLPILMLSNATASNDIVRGLDAGADDYLTKPFRIASLLARLRAHTRSYQTNSYAMLSVGPLHFNPGKRLLFDPVASRPKRLTAKEAAIFGVLYRAREKPVDRLQLMRDVWGDQPDLQSHAVEAMIYRLRQKIEPRPSRPAFLLKVAEGYRLVDPSRAAVAPAPRPKPKSRLLPDRMALSLEAATMPAKLSDAFP
jgi:DNA-binding response OmpR family regulator